MSENFDTGGPAFPTMNEMQTGPNEYRFEGMTIRDYFAAKIAAASCAYDGGVNPTVGVDVDWKQATVRTAYELADTMMEQRKKTL
jgi:hypothetical protein